MTTFVGCAPGVSGTATSVEVMGPSTIVNNRVVPRGIQPGDSDWNTSDSWLKTGGVPRSVPRIGDAVGEAADVAGATDGTTEVLVADGVGSLVAVEHAAPITKTSAAAARRMWSGYEKTRYRSRLLRDERVTTR
jgi:hypothetical protein